MTRIALALLLSISLSSLVVAGPLDDLRKAAGKQDKAPRRPNDDVEGTIWEYRAEIKKKPKKGEKTPKPLDGKFRTEGEAVFDVGRRLQLPKLPKNPKTALEKLKQGPPSELKLPTTQVKRIGEYRLSKSKLIIQFNDKKGLYGTMVLRKKKRTKNVWHGDFTEKEGKKTVRKWSVEVRPIED